LTARFFFVSRSSTRASPSRSASLRDALHVDVECRVDIERSRRRGEPGILLAQRLADEVHEVRRLRVERLAHDDDRIGFGLPRDLVGDESFVGHRTQDDVAAFLERSGEAKGDQV
jgi:hypothetical protein